MFAPNSKELNPVRLNWWLDLALFAVLMLSLAPGLTGLALHEWLGLSLAGSALFHLLLHWQWITSVLKCFLNGTTWAARLSFALNLALFVTFTVVVFTGILISREALPLFGLALHGGRAWESLHHQAADLLLFVAGLHVAVHWKWILNALKRYMLSPALNIGRKSASATVPVEVKSS
jgi:cytochrome b561